MRSDCGTEQRILDPTTFAAVQQVIPASVLCDTNRCRPLPSTQPGISGQRTTTTRLARLGLPTLVLVAAVLAPASTAAAQPALPTYTCEYTPTGWYKVGGRKCTASPGAQLDGMSYGALRMENSGTGEIWDCGVAFVYIDKPFHPNMSSSEAEVVLNDGVEAYDCRPV